MSDQPQLSLWEKIDPALRPGSTTSDGAQAQKDEAARKRVFWKLRRPLLDLMGAALWAYALMKVFVTDIDSHLFGELANYRFFFFVAALGDEVWHQS